MTDQRDLLVEWLRWEEHLQGVEKAQLFFLGAIRANDLPSDDCCVFCHERYGTTNEDGTAIECAVRLPCGHVIGNVCLQNWIDEVDNTDCFFCNKTMIPARYLLEQVEEIMETLNEMLPERVHDELSNKTTRGPLTRSIEPLWRYVGDAPSLKAYTSRYHASMVPTFEWLLVSTAEFLAAVEKYAELSVGTNCDEVNYEALCRRKREFESTYESFQSIVLELTSAQATEDLERLEDAIRDTAGEDAVGEDAAALQAPLTAPIRKHRNAVVLPPELNVRTPLRIPNEPSLAMDANGTQAQNPTPDNKSPLSTTTNEQATAGISKSDRLASVLLLCFALWLILKIAILEQKLRNSLERGG